MPPVSVCAPLNEQGVQAAYRVRRLSGGGFTPCELYAGGAGTVPVDTPYGAIVFGFGNEGRWLESPDGAVARVGLNFTFPDGGPCGGRNCAYFCFGPDLAELGLIHSSANPGEMLEARLRTACTLSDASTPGDPFVPRVSELYVRGVVTSRTSLVVGGFTEPTNEITCP